MAQSYWQRPFDMITKPKVQKIRVGKWLEGIGGGTESTNTIDKIEASAADQILAKAGIGNDEEPILVNDRDSEWCLLTTKRLIWFQEEVLRAIPWSEITLAQQPPEQAARIIRGELEKDQVTELEVFDTLGTKHLVTLEAGSPYYIIWSAILAFCNLSRKPDRIPL
jgi:hypothetical protein